MLELGGAFSAALAVDGGRIVDGLGGSSGPIGAQACGAMDGEVAYLLGAALSKRTVFSGGAGNDWLALEEGAAKAALALTVSVPAPREILVAGRHAPGGARIRSPRGSPIPCASSRTPRHVEPRSSPTGWPAGATRRSWSACGSVTRADPCSTTSGSTAPTRLGCAEMALTRAQIREAVERAGDEHWQALIRHHEDAYPESRPTPGDVCRAEAERLNQLGLGELTLVETRVERTEPTVRLVHVFEYGPHKVRLLTEPFEGYA